MSVARISAGAYGNAVISSLPQPSCPADLNASRTIDGSDLGILISEWGLARKAAPADLNSDGLVDGIDLGILLGAWGRCLN